MAGSPMLSEAVTDALRLAASWCRNDRPMTTALVFAALPHVDPANGWQRIWLHSGTPEDLRLV